MLTAKPDTATDGDDPHAISGWNGASYSDTVTTGATMMTAVYNNMEPATSVTFASRWASADGAMPPPPETGRIPLTERDQRQVCQYRRDAHSSQPSRH